MTRNEAIAYRGKIESAASTMTDESALEAVELFAPWKTGKAYAVSDRVQHDGKLYKCIQAHTSQADWAPDVTPALWKIVSVEEYPEWVQPTGAHDAYNTGDKTAHNGKRWVSNVDGNTWEPGVFGWDEVA